jgi:Protein of unknown function (DUF3040)
MALSMEEQRILAQIEQELARSEPALAAHLSSFGRPGRSVLLQSSRARERGWARSAGAGKVERGWARSAGAGKAERGWARSAGAGKALRGWARSAGAGKALRSPRVLVVASLVAVVMLTVIPVVAYALVSLRAGPRGHQEGHSAVSVQHHQAPSHPIMKAPR